MRCNYARSLVSFLDRVFTELWQERRLDTPPVFLYYRNTSLSVLRD